MVREISECENTEENVVEECLVSDSEVQEFTKEETQCCHVMNRSRTPTNSTMNNYCTIVHNYIFTIYLTKCLSCCTYSLPGFVMVHQTK